MPPRIDDTARAAILADIQAGQKSCRGIARDHDVSDATVRKIAHENGITDAFTREQTKKATEARRADMAAERTQVSALFLRRSREALESMDKPHLVYSFGGRDNTYSEHVLDRPPTADMRNLMVVAGVGLQRHLDVEKHDSGDNSAVHGLLDQIAESLRRPE
jgi:transposase-like protein